jgi:DNA-binding response OmpR family regulator
MVSAPGSRDVLYHHGGTGIAIQTRRICRKELQGMVKKSVILVDPDEDHSNALCSILKVADYEPYSVSSLSEATSNLKTQRHSALIIDLDHSSPDNRLLRKLRQEHPTLCLIGLSSRSFHPELEEALSKYIDACFAKSAGYEELLYWLKAVLDPTSHKNKEVCDSKGEPLERL